MAEAISKYIFLNDYFRVLIMLIWFSFVFVFKHLIHNKSALVQEWLGASDYMTPSKLPEPILTQFTNTYAHHQASMC